MTTGRHVRRLLAVAQASLRGKPNYDQLNQVRELLKHCTGLVEQLLVEREREYRERS